MRFRSEIVFLASFVLTAETKVKLESLPAAVQAAVNADGTPHTRD